MNPKMLDWIDQYLFFKGGSQPAPMPTDPMKEAEAQILVQDRQRAYETEQRQYAEQQAAIERNRVAEKEAAALLATENKEKDRLRKSGENRATVRGAADAYGTNALAGLGLAPGNDYGLLARYNNDLQTAFSLAPDGQDDYSKFVNPTTMFDAANTGVLTGQRNKLTSSFNKTYTPGYASRYITDDMDDSYLDDILNEQQGEAQGNIDRSIARGTLNDAGKTYAANAVTKARSAASARAQDLGLGVLDRYRKQIVDYVNPEKERIANWNYGDPTDLGYIEGGINDIVSRNKNRLGGDILNAIGDTSFFDSNLILGKAGNAMGATNIVPTGTSALGSAFATNPTLTDEEKKKQLGNSGVI